jgi:cytidine deaminase
MIDPNIIEQMKTVAVDYTQGAYAPYSGYPVGAAVLGEDGKIYGGCNIENAAYPSGICAERVAIFKAVSEGNRKLLAVVVSTPNGGSPCGACRQVMREFVDNLTSVFILDGKGKLRAEMPFTTLLPRSFGPESLEVDE